MTTASTGAIANLIIAGVGKSGTSSLFAYLAQHPDICGARVKETHYFSPLRTGEALAPIERYAAFFADWSGEPYRLEASPDYCIGGERLIHALRTTLDDPRIIMLLRDPADRLWDNYRYMRSKGRLVGIETFEAYVERGLRLCRTLPPDELAARHSGWARSFYGDFVGPWLEAFGDRLRVLFFERFVADPRATVVEVCTWLGLDPAPADAVDYRVHNATRRHRNAGLQRYALRAAGLGADFLDRRPALKRRLHEVYLTVNATDAVDAPMAPGTRAVLEEATRDSTTRMYDLLTRHGYTDVPAWLVPDRAPTSGGRRP